MTSGTAEAAFLEWASTYTRVEEDRGRTTWDDMRAAFMAGRARMAYRDAANDVEALIKHGRQR